MKTTASTMYLESIAKITLQLLTPSYHIDAVSRPEMLEITVMPLPLYMIGMQ